MRPRSRWKVRRGFNRIFIVSAACWYLASIPVLWPLWLGAMQAQRIAQLILADPVADKIRTYTFFPDEIDTSPTTAAGPVFPGPSPMRLDAWQKAMDAAREQRPLALSAFFLVFPGAVYGLWAALLWIRRGVRPTGRRIGVSRVERATGRPI